MTWAGSREEAADSRAGRLALGESKLSIVQFTQQKNNADEAVRRYLTSSLSFFVEL